MGLESKNKSTTVGCCDVVIQGRRGILKSVYLTTTGTNPIDIYDHCTLCMLACCGCLIMQVETTTTGINMPYLNVPFNKGLAVDVGACSGQITLIYE